MHGKQNIRTKIIITNYRTTNHNKTICVEPFRGSCVVSYAIFLQYIIIWKILINNNTEVKPKRAHTEAQIRVVEAFHARHKDTEDYKIKSRANAKKVYEKDKERSIIYKK